MVARDNYSFIKRQKELAKKKKREEKIKNKLDKKNALSGESAAQVPDENVPAAE
jgi:hypothetical protein